MTSSTPTRELFQCSRPRAESEHEDIASKPCPRRPERELRPHANHVFDPLLLRNGADHKHNAARTLDKSDSLIVVAGPTHLQSFELSFVDCWKTFPCPRQVEIEDFGAHSLLVGIQSFYGLSRPSDLNIFRSRHSPIHSHYPERRLELLHS
jgi:hypothetical protein